MSLPSDPTIGTQMQTGSAADSFVDLRISSGRMIAVSSGSSFTRGTVARKVSSKDRAPPVAERDTSVTIGGLAKN
jgi:hypothetical protein